MAAAPALGQVVAKAVDAYDREMVDDMGHIATTYRIAEQNAVGVFEAR